MPNGNPMSRQEQTDALNAYDLYNKKLNDDKLNDEKLYSAAYAWVSHKDHYNRTKEELERSNRAERYATKLGINDLDEAVNILRTSPLERAKNVREYDVFEKMINGALSIPNN